MDKSIWAAHEHVVPKKTMKELLLAGVHDVADLLRLNLCAVVMIDEDRYVTSRY
jgi:hypothetical protein